MPERSTHAAHSTTRTREKTAPADERPPGKPQSQVEAEAPPPPEVAAIWAAEYESRWPDI